MPRPPKHDPNAAPWERQPGETEPAWQAFRHFRDAGDSRTIAGSARAVGKSTRMLFKWSAKHGWMERVRQFTVHRDRLEQEASAKALAKQRKAAVERHVTLMEASQGVLAPAIYTLNKAVQDNGGLLPNTPDARALLAEVRRIVPALDVAIKSERLSLGMVTEHHGLSSGDPGGTGGKSLGDVLLDVFSNPPAATPKDNG